jgi:hypothetical protein
VWPRRRDRRRRRNCTHAITWSCSWFLSSFLLRSSQCRCLRSLSPRPKHLVASPSPLSRRIHSSLRLAAAAPAQTAPRARANSTSPCSCCLRRSKVEDGGDPAWARGHWWRIRSHLYPRGVFKVMGLLVRPPYAASKVHVLTAVSFLLFPLQHAWHEAMLELCLCPHQHRSCVCPSGASRAQAFNALRRFADRCTGNLLREDVHPVGLARLSKPVSRSQGPLHARPASVGRPVTAAQSTFALRPTHARERRAQHVRLGSALQDRGVRPSRRPFRGGAQPVPPPCSTILSADLIPFPPPLRAHAHAQARIFLSAQTQPATRSSQFCSRLRSATRLVAAGPQS